MSSAIYLLFSNLENITSYTRRRIIQVKFEFFLIKYELINITLFFINAVGNKTGSFTQIKTHKSTVYRRNRRTGMSVVVLDIGTD